VLIPGLLEHVERAGVHSGDSVAVFPPQLLSASDQALIVATMRRLCLAIGVRGLVNAQFIVRDDGVYVLEVNPRASRTVPFLSKVTGVPMVALATAVALGADLADLGWRDGLLPPPALVAVKAPVFSTAKLRGVDPTLGPGMQSTGEVIGLDGDVALISVAPRDVSRLPELAAALADVGYHFMATPGTAAALRELGHVVREAALIGAESEALPSVLEVIAAGGVALVINTPAPRAGAEGILCLTAIDTAVAAARSLAPAVQARLADVRSLAQWTASTVA
jgi:carbamoyl-phosphate synthase large subunit